MKRFLFLFIAFSLGSVANAQWVSQFTNFPDAGIVLKDIQIVDANNVWTACFSAADSSAPYLYTLRTTDGGVTWNPVVIDNGFPDWSVDNLCVIDMNTAWIACTDLVSTPANGGVFKTIDGGVTWTRQLETSFVEAGSFLNTVQFVDANVGIAMGDPLTSDLEMYRTTDGGANWVAVAANVLPDVIAGEYGINSGNVTVGNSMWFVTNKGKIYHTTDAGLTWTKKNTPITSFSQATPPIGGTIFFKDENVGCLLSRTGTGATALYKIHTTTNAGTTWTAGIPCVYTSIGYVPGTNIMVGTKNPGSAYSVDNGATWTVLEATNGKYDPVFLNATTGFAGGVNTATAGGIFKFTGNQLGFNTFSNDKSFKASPNPTTGLVTLTGKNITTVIVTDVLGKQISNINFTSLNDVSVDMTNFNPGMYMVKVTNNEGNTSTIKVVRQ